MGIPVLVCGESGSGKSTSLRNFDASEVGIFNVAGKPLPFRKNLPSINNASYKLIIDRLKKPSKKAYVIDDSQYLLAFDFFDRAKETGFQKFTDIALNFIKLVKFVIRETPDDCIVYFLHHVEENSDGMLKAKTIGKMIDEKLTLEGLFTIVLFAKSSKDRYYFQTQSEGYTTAKSPIDMFDAEIDNDLKMVDTIIREYYFA